MGWGGMGVIPPNPIHSTLPRQGGWLRECRDQEGRNFSLEDLPEKCHAGSDEERNLDRKREGEKAIAAN